jgi:hypothetical protein
MSEDIQFKITADESGALNAFKRVRNEVLNNDKALERVGKQGKLTSTALKDAANVLGPEFQILGDRIDHISGALADVNGASMLAKGSLVALVAVGSAEVGLMIGEWIAGTEQWKATFDETTKSIASDMQYITKQNQERFDNEIKLAQLAATEEQKNNELSKIRVATNNALTQATLTLTKAQEGLNESLANDFLGRNTEDNAIAQEAVRIAQEQVNALKQQADIVDRLRYGGSEIEEQIAQRQREADAIKAQNEALAKQSAEQERLQQTQVDYLANLDAELVRIRDGEEAYLRLTLAKQGFTDESIESALRLKTEINELSELSKIRQTEATNAEREERDSPIRIGQRGELRGDQQRFITRGPGMKGEEKLLAAAKEQAQRAAEMLKEAKKQTALLAKIPKGVTE